MTDSSYQNKGDPHICMRSEEQCMLEPEMKNSSHSVTSEKVCLPIGVSVNDDSNCKENDSCSSGSSDSDGSSSNLTTEEDIIDSLFFICDVDHVGKANIQRVIEYLKFTTSSISENEQDLKKLAAMLDPQGMETFVTLEKYRSTMKHWIESIRKQSCLEDDIYSSDECSSTSELSMNTVPFVSSSTISPYCQAEVLSNISCQKEHMELQGKIEGLQHQNRRLLEDTAKLQHQLVTQEDHLTTASNEKDKLTRKIKSLQEMVELKESLQVENEELRNANSRLLECRKDLENKLNQIEKEKSSCDLQIEDLELKLQTVSGQVDCLSVQKHDLYILSVENKHRISQLLEMKTMQEVQLNERFNEVKDMKDEIKIMSRNMEELRQENDALKRQNTEVEQELLMFAKMETFPDMLPISEDDNSPTLYSTPSKARQSICMELKQMRENGNLLPMPLCAKEFLEEVYSDITPFIDDVEEDERLSEDMSTSENNSSAGISNFLPQKNQYVNLADHNDNTSNSCIDELLQEIDRVKRENLYLEEKCQKTECKVKDLEDALSQSQEELDVKNTQCDQLEENLSSCKLECELDLKEIWRLVHKDVERECTDDQKDASLPEISSNIRSQISHEIQNLKIQLQKREAALDILTSHKSKPDHLSLEHSACSCFGTGSNASSPLVEALDIDVFNGNQPLHRVRKRPYSEMDLSGYSKCEDNMCNSWGYNGTVWNSSLPPRQTSTESSNNNNSQTNLCKSMSSSSTSGAADLDLSMSTLKSSSGRTRRKEYQSIRWESDDIVYQSSSSSFDRDNGQVEGCLEGSRTVDHNDNNTFDMLAPVTSELRRLSFNAAIASQNYASDDMVHYPRRRSQSFQAAIESGQLTPSDNKDTDTCRFPGSKVTRPSVCSCGDNTGICAKCNTRKGVPVQDKLKQSGKKSVLGEKDSGQTLDESVDGSHTVDNYCWNDNMGPNSYSSHSFSHIYYPPEGREPVNDTRCSPHLTRKLSILIEEEDTLSETEVVPKSPLNIKSGLVSNKLRDHLHSPQSKQHGNQREKMADGGQYDNETNNHPPVVKTHLTYQEPPAKVSVVTSEREAPSWQVKGRDQTSDSRLPTPPCYPSWDSDVGVTADRGGQTPCHKSGAKLPLPDSMSSRELPKQNHSPKSPQSARIFTSNTANAKDSTQKVGSADHRTTYTLTTASHGQTKLDTKTAVSPAKTDLSVPGAVQNNIEQTMKEHNSSDSDSLAKSCKLAKLRQDHLNKKREQMKHVKMPELMESQEVGSVNGTPESNGGVIHPPLPSNQPAFPSIPNSFLHSLQLNSDSGDDDGSEQANELEIEKKFTSLSLAFKTDKLTLEKRLEIQERSRDIAEQNVDTELKGLKDNLETLNQLCIDTQVRDVLRKIQAHLDILEQATARVSSRAEVFGAVQQEKRMSKAIEIMITHVDTIRMVHDRVNSELEEARKLIQDSRPFGSAGLEMGDFPHMSKRSMSLSQQGQGLQSRMKGRRVSEVAIPRALGGVGVPSLTHSSSMDASTMSLECKSPSWSRKDSPDSEDAKSRFQCAVASMAMKNAVSDTFRRGSLGNQVSKNSTPPKSRENSTESKEVQDKSPIKQNSKEEEAFQKGFKQGYKAQMGRELSSLREHQNSINQNLEELMDSYDSPPEEEERAFKEVVMEKIWEMVPEWEIAGKRLRMMLAGLIFFMAICSIIMSFLPLGHAVSVFPDYRHMDHPPL
ncbi:uncharacterized protein [Argopecten irradians]